MNEGFFKGKMMIGFMCDFRMKGFFAILQLLTLLWVGCADGLTSKQQLETIMASGAGCFAPCWQGLTPGLSTEGDFLRLVESASDPQFDNLRVVPLYNGRVEYIWYDEITSMVGQLRVNENGFVSNIDFTLPTKPVLAAILDVLGEPDAYTAELFQAEKPFLDLFLYFHKQGIVVQVEVIPYEVHHPTCQAEIIEGMSVREIFLVPPGTAAEMRRALADQIIISDEDRPWTGLGPVALSKC